MLVATLLWIVRVFLIAFQFLQFHTNLMSIMLSLWGSEQLQTDKIYLSFFHMTLRLGRSSVIHIKNWWQKISSFRSLKCIMEIIFLFSLLEIGKRLFKFSIKKVKKHIGYILISFSKIFPPYLDIPSCLRCQQGSLWPAIMVFQNYQHSNCSCTCF